jgi:hypothetical protein
MKQKSRSHFQPVDLSTRTRVLLSIELHDQHAFVECHIHFLVYSRAEYKEYKSLRSLIVREKFPLF